MVARSYNAGGQISSSRTGIDQNYCSSLVIKYLDLKPLHSTLLSAKLMQHVFAVHTIIHVGSNAVPVPCSVDPYCKNSSNECVRDLCAEI